jgi:hypothetical protein
MKNLVLIQNNYNIFRHIKKYLNKNPRHADLVFLSETLLRIRFQLRQGFAGQVGGQAGLYANSRLNSSSKQKIGSNPIFYFVPETLLRIRYGGQAGLEGTSSPTPVIILASSSIYICLS